MSTSCLPQPRRRPATCSRRASARPCPAPCSTSYILFTSSDGDGTAVFQTRLPVALYTAVYMRSHGSPRCSRSRWHPVLRRTAKSTCWQGTGADSLEAASSVSADPSACARRSCGACWRSRWAPVARGQRVRMLAGHRYPQEAAASLSADLLARTGRSCGACWRGRWRPAARRRARSARSCRTWRARSRRQARGWTVWCTCREHSLDSLTVLHCVTACALHSVAVVRVEALYVRHTKQAAGTAPRAPVCTCI